MCEEDGVSDQEPETPSEPALDADQWLMIVLVIVGLGAVVMAFWV